MIRHKAKVLRELIENCKSEEVMVEQLHDAYDELLAEIIKILESLK